MQHHACEGWLGGIGKARELLRPCWPRSRIPPRASGGGAFALPLGARTLRRQLYPSLPDRQRAKPCRPVEAGQLRRAVHQFQVLRLEPEDHRFRVLSRTIDHAAILLSVDISRQSIGLQLTP